MSARVVALLGGSISGRQALAQALAMRLNAIGWDAQCLLDDPCQMLLQHKSPAPCQAERRSMLMLHAAAIAKARQGTALLIIAQPLLPLALRLDADLAGQDWRRMALTQLRETLLNVLMPSDVSVEADALSPSVQEPSLRQVLHEASVSYAAVNGSMQAQTDQAMTSIEHALDTPQRVIRAAGSPRWRWMCERCDDGACEHASKA